MARRYKTFPTRQAAADFEDDLFAAYAEDECIRRGLPPGSSLDMRDGVPVAPVTTGYAGAIEVPSVGYVIELDDRAQGWDGRDVPVRGGGTRRLRTNDGAQRSTLAVPVRAKLDEFADAEDAPQPLRAHGPPNDRPKKPAKPARTWWPFRTLVTPPPVAEPAPAPEPAPPATEPGPLAAVPPETPPQLAEPYQVPHGMHPPTLAAVLLFAAWAAVVLAMRTCG
jgi:hypothetical protein